MKLSIPLNRRGALWVLGGAGASLALVNGGAQRAVAQTFDCILSPEMTEGPYWVDEKLLRSDIRSDTATGVVRAGVPLELEITAHLITDTACGVLPGAYVDIWHCDAGGLYSDVQQNNTVGQDFLRGYQITDENGVVRFTSIYPGWYRGRTIHIHFRIRTYDGDRLLDTFTSQLYFDEAVNDTVMSKGVYNTRGARDTRNANDNIYGGRTSVLLALSETEDGYAAKINVGVDLTTPVVAAPALAAGGVVSAASFTAGVTPQGFVSIFGSNLAETVRAVAVEDLVDGSLPTTLAGSSVQINNKPAFMYYVSPTQLNVQAPDDDALGAVPVSVTTAEGTTSSSVDMAATPAFFTTAGYVAAVHADGVIVTGAAAPGETLQLYGTGFGATDPAVAAGLVHEQSYPLVEPVTVTIGGLDAVVSYAGLVATGLYQLNVTIPQLSDGDYEVVAAVGNVSTQDGVLLRVEG